MHHLGRDNTTYTGNRADGESINIYGNVHGDVHFPSKPGEAGGLALQCLRDLRVTDPREDRARIEGDKDRLLRDCYAWILRDASFRRWKADDGARLLWIKGDPGKGKTMMTMGVIAELSSRDVAGPATGTMSRVLAKLNFSSNKCPLAYFFCQSTRPELNNAVSVLRGLIYLLVVQRPKLIRHVKRRYETAGRQLFEGANAIYGLREMLSEMLHDALPTTYLLVDALDECTSGLAELLRIITDDSLARLSKVKWLVTSRNLPDIERYLQPDPRGAKVSLEVSARHVSKAVAAFIDFKVQHLAKVQRYDGETQAEVQRQLSNKAGGTFLWVSLVCKELETVEHYCVRDVLEELPPGLDPLYECMMGHVLAQKRTQTAEFCKDVLRSVTLAYRPLRVAEVAAIAGLPQKQFRHVSGYLDLISRCGSFLTIRDDNVFFVHLSAKDYFTSGNGRQIFNGTLADEQGRITHRLLDAMDSTLQRDICSLRKPGVRIQEAASKIKNSSLSQIAYACEHWVQHLQAWAEDGGEMLLDNSKVHSFFQEHLLHWLEAIGLLQKMPEAITALQTLQEMLKGRKSMLSKVIHDALRFTMWSGSGIQEAPLQVYYGALIFAPEQSIIRRQFSQDMPAWIQVRFGHDKDWGPLLQTLEGHTQWVTSVAFSPAGDRLASASNDKTVRLWDAGTGQLLQTLKGHTNGVNSIAFSPAGDRLASASYNDTVRVWDINTGQPLHIFEGYTDLATSVVFSPVGDLLVSAFNNEMVQVWDAKTGQLLLTFKGRSHSVSSMVFSPAGDLVAWASDDKMVRVWDIKTGRPLHTFEGHTNWVTSVAFSPAADRLASASHDRTLRVWDTKTGQLLHTFEGHTDLTTSVAFSPAADRLASASHDRTLRVWDAKTGQLLHTFEGHTDLTTSVAFSPVGDRLASASWDKTVRVWDASTGQLLQTLKGHTNGVTSIAFSPAADRLASASRDETVRVWDVKTRRLLHTIKDCGFHHMVAFSPAGDRLVSASSDRTVRVWDANTGQPLHTLEGYTDLASSMAFSPAGDRLASVSWDRTVRVWDANTGQPLQTLEGHTHWVTSVAFSPAGDRLASASNDKTVRLWDVKTGQPLHTLEYHIDHVSSVAFSPAGDRLASASRDETVRVWDAKTGQPLHTFKDCDPMHMLAFSSDGSCLEAGGRTIRLSSSVSSTSLLTSQHRILVRDSWLIVGSEDSIWLPADFRPSVTSVHDQQVAVGCRSGRLLLLELG